MSNAAESTPYLLIVGDLLGEDECGLICHRRDLDFFEVTIRPTLHAPGRKWSRHSASTNLTLPVLVRLVEVTLAGYPDGPLSETNRRERKHLRRALKALKAADGQPT